jgi:hypothetical protein
MSTDTRSQVKDHSRQPWQRPALKSVGTVGDVLQGGNGKVTVIVGDPGEPQKVPSHES